MGGPRGLDHRPDHTQRPAVEVDRIGAQSGGLAPAQSAISGNRHDPAMPMWDRGQQPTAENGAFDDLLIGVAAAPLLDLDVLVRFPR